MNLLPSDELAVRSEKFSALEKILIFVGAAFSCIFCASIHCWFKNVNIKEVFERRDQAVRRGSEKLEEDFSLSKEKTTYGFKSWIVSNLRRENLKKIGCIGVNSLMSFFRKRCFEQNLGVFKHVIDHYSKIADDALLIVDLSFFELDFPPTTVSENHVYQRAKSDS